MENDLIVDKLKSTSKAITDNNPISNMNYICEKSGFYLTFGFPQSDILFSLMFGISLYLIRFHSKNIKPNNNIINKCFN